MAHFINLAFTDLNEDGEPLISVDESWINLDQVIEIIPMLGNNLFRRHLSICVPERQQYCS